jgi:hypothetical protein
LNALSSAIRHVADARKQQAAQPVVNAAVQDDCDVYGRHIANELRSVTDPFTRDYIKKRFNDILFETKWQQGGRTTHAVQSNRPQEQPWQSTSYPTGPTQQSTGVHSFSCNNSYPVNAESQLVNMTANTSSNSFLQQQLTYQSQQSAGHTYNSNSNICYPVNAESQFANMSANTSSSSFLHQQHTYQSPQSAGHLNNSNISYHVNAESQSVNMSANSSSNSYLQNQQNFELQQSISNPVITEGQSVNISAESSASNYFQN